MEIKFKKSKSESGFNYIFEFVKDNLFPDKGCITSIFSLVVIEANIFLTKNHRGGELPGGHIEIENLIMPLCGEVKEVVGTTIKNIYYWGYKK